MKDLVGTTLKNRYKVLELIGRGGMAEVYKVWDSVRAVPLAMKLLREDLAEDKVFLRRFRREAQNLARLQHPQIVRSYGLEQDGDYSFLLMDYVEGTTLRKEIFRAKKPFSAEQVLKVMHPVCSALHYAHQVGIIHCDAKPANIMIDKGGRVFVTDFGIARMTDGATATMVGAGTPAYMSPEQIKGAEPTPQTDIYALGVVLFEMLTGGERPFTGERSTLTGTTGEMVRWEKMNLEPPLPREWNPSISPELEGMVLKCLRKDPGERFGSTLDILGAFETLIVPADAHALEGDLPSGEQAEEEKLPTQERNQEPSSPAAGSAAPAYLPPSESPQRSVGRLAAVPGWAWVIIASLAVALAWSILRVYPFEDPGTDMLRMGSSVEGRARDSSGDRWQVQLYAGDVVAISMRALGGMDTYLELLDPQGLSIETDDDGGEGSNSWITRSIQETGVYTIVARGYNGDEGEYALAVEELEDAFQGSLTPGRNGAQTLTESIPIHHWTYEGRAGETLSISMEGLDGLDTFLELQNPDGETVEYDDDGGEGRNSFLEVGLEQSGTYTIVARGYEYRAGSYELTLGSPGGSSSSNTLSIGSALQDEVTDSSGDSWPLDVHAGDIVVITMNEVDGMDTYLELLDPQGNIVTTNDDGGSGSNSRLFTVVSQTGTYTVIARGYGGQEGEYILAVEDVSNALEGALTRGRTVSRTLTESNPMDIWTYEGRSGELLSISMEGLDGFDTVLELWSLSGARIEYDDDGGEGGDSFLEAALEQSGTYIIIARGYAYHVGSYELTLGSPGGSSPSNTLSIGLALQDEVTDSSGDSWPLDVHTGDIVVITMDEVDDMDTYLELLDPQGNIVTTDDDGGPGHNSRMIAVIRQTGTYTVIARGYGGQEGGYILAVEDASNALEGALTRGQPVMRTLTEVEPMHVWLYEGHAGERLSISMEGVEGLDAYLEMYGPGGERIGRNDDGGEGLNALLEIELGHIGTYTILARDLGGRAGSYELMIE